MVKSSQAVHFIDYTKNFGCTVLSQGLKIQNGWMTDFQINLYWLILFFVVRNWSFQLLTKTFNTPEYQKIVLIRQLCSTFFSMKRPKTFKKVLSELICIVSKQANTVPTDGASWVVEIYEWSIIWNFFDLTHPVRNSLWLKKNRTVTMKANFIQFWCVEYEFIVKKWFHIWTSELWCIWHIFGKFWSFHHFKAIL